MKTDSEAIRPGYEQRADARHDPRLDWWREARFGMFIHWGLYAQPHERWVAYPDTVTHHWTGEWVQHVKRIPRDQYVRWASSFNPRGFDAEEWVSLARRAGQRYLVITAKHHDGFCLFKTATTDFNVVDASPFGRDIIAELAEACRRQNMPFGVYYSQAQDWHDPNGLGNDWDDNPASKNFRKYLEGRVKPQLRELLTGYGDIAVVWFDTPMTMTVEESRELVDLAYALQPKCLVSGRIGNSLGDYTSFRDNRFASGAADFDFESPMTMNRTWGYVAGDSGFKSGSELLWTLIDTVSKGGNLLCNIGPDEMGLIPDGNRTPLLEVGAWLERNGRSIYGSRPGGTATPGALRCTRSDGTVFLHVITWPVGNVVVVPDELAAVREAEVLGMGARVAVEKAGGKPVVHLNPEWLAAKPIVLAFSAPA